MYAQQPDERRSDGSTAQTEKSESRATQTTLSADKSARPAVRQCAKQLALCCGGALRDNLTSLSNNRISCAVPVPPLLGSHCQGHRDTSRRSCLHCWQWNSGSPCREYYHRLNLLNLWYYLLPAVQIRQKRRSLCLITIWDSVNKRGCRSRGCQKVGLLRLSITE